MAALERVRRRLRRGNYGDQCNDSTLPREVVDVINATSIWPRSAGGDLASRLTPRAVVDVPGWTGFLVEGTADAEGFFRKAFPELNDAQVERAARQLVTRVKLACQAAAQPHILPTRRRKNFATDW